MTAEEERTETTRSRGTLLVAGLVVALAAVGIVWWQWDAITGRAPAGGAVAGDEAAVRPADAGSTEVGDADATSGRARAEREWEALTGAPPTWPADFADPSDCEAVESDLVRICAALDAKDYVRTAAGAGGACALVRQVADELAARPPEFSSELKSHPTMLGNVFHLFRVLGKPRMDLLRRIQFEEQALAEPAAMALFRWARSRESCARSGATTLHGGALYDYAGFLFETLGGQAYLRRRSPRVEALASFYALVVIDRSQQAGHNPGGLDPRGEIERTRELIAAQPFVFGDHYLLVLDRMAEAWKERSSPEPAR